MTEEHPQRALALGGLDALPVLGLRAGEGVAPVRESHHGAGLGAQREGGLDALSPPPAPRSACPRGAPRRRGVAHRRQVFALDPDAPRASAAAHRQHNLHRPYRTAVGVDAQQVALAGDAIDAHPELGLDPGVVQHRAPELDQRLLRGAPQPHPPVARELDGWVITTFARVAQHRPPEVAPLLDQARSQPLRLRRDPRGDARGTRPDHQHRHHPIGQRTPSSSDAIASMACTPCRMTAADVLDAAATQSGSVVARVGGLRDDLRALAAAFGLRRRVRHALSTVDRSLAAESTERASAARSIAHRFADNVVRIEALGLLQRAASAWRTLHRDLALLHARRDLPSRRRGGVPRIRVFMRPGARSVALALAVALLAWCGVALGQLSPGPLSRAHRALEGGPTSASAAMTRATASPGAASSVTRASPPG